MRWKLEIKETKAGTRYRILDDDTNKVELPWSTRERAAGMYLRRSLYIAAGELVRAFKSFPNHVHVGEMKVHFDDARHVEYYDWARGKLPEEIVAELDRIRKVLEI